MLKFDEHLTDQVASKTSSMFSEEALNELKELAQEKKQEVIPQKVIELATPQLDIVKPAKVIKVNPNINKKNLFTLPSIVTALFFVLSTVYVDYDAALEDGNISRRERLKLIYLLAGAVSVLVSRATEGNSRPVVPGWLPGPHLTDLNNDGQVTEEDERIYNETKGL